MSDLPHLNCQCPFIRLGMALVIALLPVLPGCVATTSRACNAGEKQAVSDTFYFGTATPTGLVSEADWQDFLRTSVTPRFPDGFTAWAASGQWKSSDGSIVREASHVLSVIHTDDERSKTGALQVMADYKHRFRQRAVLRVRSPACVSF